MRNSTRCFLMGVLLVIATYFYDGADPALRAGLLVSITLSFVGGYICACIENTY